MIHHTESPHFFLKTYEEDTLLFFTIYSLTLHPCHAHIMYVGWSSRLRKEGKKEKLGTLWSGRWLWCSQQVCASVKWFTNGSANVGSAEIRSRAVPSATRKHMKQEPALDLQGPQRVHTPQGPAPSPRRAAPIQQKCLQQLDFAPPTSEGFSSGKERVLIPALPHLPPPCLWAGPARCWMPTVHRDTGWLKWRLKFFRCPFAHHLPLLGKCFSSVWAGWSLLQNWKDQICSLTGVTGRTTHPVCKPPD